MLDGLRACEWGISVYGLPAQIKFEIQGKKAEIKRKGFMANTPVLYLEGKESRQIKNICCDIDTPRSIPGHVIVEVESRKTANYIF